MEREKRQGGNAPSFEFLASFLTNVNNCISSSTIIGWCATIMGCSHLAISTRNQEITHIDPKKIDKKYPKSNMIIGGIIFIA